ncbi:UNVERIFIED_CONTAM: Retrovirus-related Pol polyprotein from transposon RE1 [Sesamum latifolium]|uniref:Retrovirus-related Pol polyprotein from transposon RE1 n=1 Tax=Sesamum latifolium TaxID=2727402 RepID=A0AAW2SSZ0_9LAMI
MASTSNNFTHGSSGDIRTVAEVPAARNQSTENSGLVMISAPFNGSNWLTWSRSVRIALEGKDKLGYIDGSYMRPHDGSVDLKQWRITDSLVRTWILSTMVKEIVNAFLYVPSARALWLELEASNKSKMEEIEENQLMQFLMGLSEPYDSIRSQILVLDPLPSVNKAYSMVLRVERQRKVNLEYADIGENNAMNDSCFKLHGTPEWYKDLNEQKKWGTATNRVYNATDTLLSEESKTMQRNEVVLVSELMEALKMVQTKVPQDPVRVHFAHDTDMAGITLHKKTEKAGSRDWIVDSGATNHMCGDACAFHSLTKLLNPIKIHFPDNSVSYETHTGNITLSPTLTLSNVLLIPSFKHNLLSVSQLCQSLSIAFVFLTSSCILQDLMTKRPLAIGTKVGRLYFLYSNSFSVSPQHTCYSVEDCSAHNENFVVWHRPLGHPSLAVLTHVKGLDIGAISKDHGQKGYKLFDLDNHVIIISRDVTFHEHIFPYIDHSELSPSPMLIPTSILDHHTDLIQPVLPPTPISDPNPPTPTLPVTQIPDSDPPLQRSQRHIKTPSWLTDFHCNHSSDSFIHPSTLALSHTDFLAALSTIQEPSTYLQANGCKEWEDAMSQEIEALEQNETWEVVPLPKGKKTIGCKWVYKVKVRADGSIDRYKARLVAKGYNQVKGVDYVDRFSPVAKAVTVRTFLAVATGFSWPIH